MRNCPAHSVNSTALPAAARSLLVVVSVIPRLDPIGGDDTRGSAPGGNGGLAVRRRAFGSVAQRPSALAACATSAKHRGRKEVSMAIDSKTSLEVPAVQIDRPEPEGIGESRYLFAGIAVLAIWLAAAAASIWSPDLVSGTQQEHIPLAAIFDWFYAALATGLVLMAFGRRSPGASRSLWLGFTVAVAGIWFVVAVASIFAPSIETGSDPTTLPIAALATPIAGVITTAFVSVFVAGSAGESKR
jgi:hypothetical protein